MVIDRRKSAFLAASLCLATGLAGSSSFMAAFAQEKSSQVEVKVDGDPHLVDERPAVKPSPETAITPSDTKAQSKSQSLEGQPKDSASKTTAESPTTLEQRGSDATRYTRDTRAQELELMTQQALEHFDLAHYYQSRWDYDMAELEYEAAIMYSPDLKVAHRDYCLLSMVRFHPLRALAELMMVVGLGEPVPLDDDEKAQLKQKAAKMHYRKAIAAGRKDKWDKAIAELKWAKEYAPDNAAIQRSLAFSYASKGDFASAEKEYMTGFAEDPSDAYSHADFAFMLSEHGQDDRAYNQLSQAVKLDPKSAALHVDLGWLAETKGDFQTADNELRQAIKLCPKQAGLWMHLGRVLERAGKPGEAKSAYTEALAIDSTEDEAKRRLEILQNGTGAGKAGSESSKPQTAPNPS